MTAAAADKSFNQIHPLRAFTVRAEARALLVYCRVLNVDTAINDLVADASKSGLLAEVGRSVLQSIMLAAFAKYKKART